jgi:phage replication protein O protein
MTIERFIPNSFQISNAFVDEMMGELSGNAVKCYLIIVRKTRGWGKESDAIAISQFIDGKKLKDERTVRAALDELLAAGVVGKMDFKGRPSVYFLVKPPAKNDGGVPANFVPPAKNAPTTKNEGAVPTNFVPTPPTKNVPHRKQENKKQDVAEISEVEKDGLGFADNSGFASPDGLADLNEFPMADGWKPADETAFDEKLRRSQIPCLADSRVADALVEFASYWQAAGKVLTQAMWEHKFFQLLARQKAQGAFASKPKDPSHRRLNQPQQGGNGAGDGQPNPRRGVLRPLGRMV